VAGCGFGFAVSAEFIVRSLDPFERDSTLSPDMLARALENAFATVKINIPGTRGESHITEMHIYRVAPTFSSIRRQFGLPTPWIGERGEHKHLAAVRTVTPARPRTTKTTKKKRR
jgi:hypothetical protein